MVADMKIAVIRRAKALGLLTPSRWLTRRGLPIRGIWLGGGHYGDLLFMSPGSAASSSSRAGRTDRFTVC